MDPLEKEMATHSSILAWRILSTEEPGGLLSMGSHRVRHDWGDLACMHAMWIHRASPVAQCKESTYNSGAIGDMGLIPESGRSPGGGHGTRSSILAWRIPWTEEPGGLQSIGLLTVKHNWSDLACTHVDSQTENRSVSLIQTTVRYRGPTLTF